MVMTFEEVTEEVLVHKVGVSLIQRGVVWIGIFGELGQPIVPIKRKEPRVFVPGDKKQHCHFTKKLSKSNGLHAFLGCIP